MEGNDEYQQGIRHALAALTIHGLLSIEQRALILAGLEAKTILLAGEGWPGPSL